MSEDVLFTEGLNARYSAVQSRLSLNGNLTLQELLLLGIYEELVFQRLTKEQEDAKLTSNTATVGRPRRATPKKETK